ncbi:hypothetical protein TanjilG_15211 [Lupinus angustifolius]|uniref:VQ domain-containing protein n=1 Tax=Lupinus angustifolius TaxID=3871 RepID=A0A1J7HP86_LUPAN|nr:PREDICTED: VQ motif-containing protein 19-like [Lupinus angustifolius]OIW08250.1 hypothetical protein TanjilG_15211 [Lupinus angustifolius]
MEISSRLQLHDREKNQSPMNSPKTSFISSNHSIGLQIPTTQPLTPKTNPKSDSNNPYPTTFVQADTSSFKQVVQMLTGSQETTKPTPLPTSRNFNIPPIKTASKKQQGFKLYERRNSNLKNSLMINTLVPNLSYNKSEILSPSLLDFPSLSLLSPVTPMNDHDPFDKSSLSSLRSSSEEDKAIAEKGFYLHSTPREFEPQLLSLFPLSSPRVSDSSS